LVATGGRASDLQGRGGCSRAAVVSGGSKLSWLAPRANMEEASVAVSARPRRCRRACPSQIRNRVVRLRVPWNAFGEVQCLDNFIDVAFAPAVGIDRPSLERIGRVALDQIHMPGIG